MVDILPQYKPGSDLTLLNVFYQYKMKDASGKKLKDCIVLIYKDNEVNQVKKEIIYEPEYTYFKLNDGIVVDHNLLFAEKENCHPITCKYNSIVKSIAQECGVMDYYNENIQTGNFQENRKLHTLYDIFRSDVDIEDYYRFIFAQKFQNNVVPVTKAFFDIEVDSRYAAGDFPEMGECPINAISYMDLANNCIHSFLLRDKRNPQIEDLERKLESGEFSYKQIREFLVKAIGGLKKLKYYRLEDTTVDIHFYDDEIELLSDFFSTVHYYKPNFILGYNSSGFDLSYIIARIETLGHVPADIMCDKSWNLKIVKHYVDHKNLSMFAERGDYTFISGYTVWIDQMIQFASRRKNKYGSFTSFKLDDIGAKIAKVKKLDYSDITTNIVMLPWLDYITFVLYNIFDVVVQKCIEQRTEDIEYIFAKCIMNNTSYRRGHRQTVYLINRMVAEFDKLGFIIGNNVNRWNEKPEKFAGALVHDPTYTNSYAKMTINGIPIFIVDNLQDFDYKSLYPNITLQHNISPNTQEGRIIIPEKVYENENVYGTPKYQRGGEFIENLISDNHIVFCHRWFHLANVNEMMDDMNEYFRMYVPNFTSDGQFETYAVKDNRMVISPLEPIHLSKEFEVNPIEYNTRSVSPIFYYGDRVNVKREMVR